MLHYALKDIAEVFSVFIVNVVDSIKAEVISIKWMSSHICHIITTISSIQEIPLLFFMSVTLTF